MRISKMILFCIIVVAFAVSARVLVVVESGYYNNSDFKIQGKAHIDRYMQDVETIDGVTIDSIVYSNISGKMSVQVEALWKRLLAYYNAHSGSSDSLEGVVLVGDLPIPIQEDDAYDIRNSDYPYMEMYDDEHSTAYSQTTILDSVWDYKPSENFYHNSFPNGNTSNKLEIWVSRVMGDNLKHLRAPGAKWGDFLTADEIVSRYFDKVHDRMTSPALMPSRAMAMGHIEEFGKDNRIDGKWVKFTLPAHEALKDLREDVLCFKDLPVDTTFYIYNFDADSVPLQDNTGDHRINSASNWQSQLQAGPFGNINKNFAFGNEEDNRYITAPDSAQFLPFDPSDTLGYEWIGLYEHGAPWQVGFNSKNNLLWQYERGAFFTSTPTSVVNIKGAEMVESGGYNDDGYVLAYRDVFDSTDINTPFQFNWVVRDLPADSDYDLYYYVDASLLPLGKRYEDNSLYINYNQIVDSASTGKYEKYPEIGGRWNFIGGDGWVEFFSTKNLFVTDSTKAIQISFHPFLDTLFNVPSDLQEVLPITAIKIVNSQGYERILTIKDSFYSKRFGFQNRYFAHMQDDGGQSKAHFFLQNSCSIANTAVTKDNLSLSYAMGHAGLISIGASSANRSGASYSPITTTLADPNKCFGDAFLKQIPTKTNVNYTLFGAGTLKSRPYKPFNPTGDLTVTPDGSGDFEELSKAVKYIKDGGTLTVKSGSYKIESMIINTQKDVTITFEAGANITLTTDTSGIFLSGDSSKIVGDENITINKKVFVFNTPLPRTPLAVDNLIGMFAEITYGISAAKNGNTTVIGPGKYVTFGLANYDEGIVGSLDPTSPNDFAKSTVVRLYFDDLSFEELYGFKDVLERLENSRPTNAPLTSASQTHPAVFYKNFKMDVNDVADSSNAFSGFMAIYEVGGTVMENIFFENFRTKPVSHITSIELGNDGDPSNGFQKNDYTEDTKAFIKNCTFKNFRIAIGGLYATEANEAPVIENCSFIGNTYDIKFVTGSNAMGGVRGNSMNNIRVGDIVYSTQSSVDTLLLPSGVPAGSNKIGVPTTYVDRLNNDLRLQSRSQLIDVDDSESDIGTFNTDLVMTFSHYLNIELYFNSGDTVITDGNLIVKNTIGDAVEFIQTTTTELRPVNLLTIKKNFQDNPAFAKVSFDEDYTIAALPSWYTVFEATYNGITCGAVLASSLYNNTEAVTTIVPDNIAPVRVENIAVAAFNGGVKISWSAAREQDLSRYKVYRKLVSQNHDDAIQIASIDKSETEYFDALGNVDYYRYYVVAYDNTGNQSEQFSGVKFPLKIEMKDESWSANNVSNPRLIITNLADSIDLKDFTVRLWYSREEFPDENIVVDKYWTAPAGITMEAVVHSVDSNIVYIDIKFPDSYILAPGASTVPEHIAFGVHYLPYYPATMDKSNDWSLQGITDQWSETEYVTVYNKDGELIYGNEFIANPSTNSAPTNITISDSVVIDQSPAGTVVGYLTAIDPNQNDAHLFYLASGTGDFDNSKFTIVNNELKTTVVFDISTKDAYSIRIGVIDISGNRFERSLVVNVINLDTGCTGGVGSSEVCAYELDGVNSEEITLDLTGKDSYWIYSNTWPSWNDSWTADIRLFINHAGVEIPAMTIEVNGVAHTYNGGWFTSIDIPDYGPYTIKITAEKGPFKFKLSN